MPFTEDNLKELLPCLQGEASACRELRSILRDPGLEGLPSGGVEHRTAQRQTAERVAGLAAAQSDAGERLAAS